MRLGSAPAPRRGRRCSSTSRYFTIGSACTQPWATARRLRRGPAWRQSPSERRPDILIYPLHTKGGGPPLFALVGVLIKLDSPGPLFFLQRRYGFNQEPFRILKFRTMTTTEDGDRVVQATRGDARVTRVGRWLRRFSVDELPQLLNVLKGDMS